jgi:hypothetical protein
MAGDLGEWMIDYWDGSSAYTNPCVECANFTTASYRVFRGGLFHSPVTPDLLPPNRGIGLPYGHGGGGIRCARAP